MEKVVTATELKLKVLWNLVTRLDDRIIILEYLYNNRIGNIALGSYKSISEATGLPTSRVISYLRLLQEKDIIRRRGKGVFIVNDAVLHFEKTEEQDLVSSTSE